MQSKVFFEHEWDFIKDETHKEKPTKNNILKRELLFILQILLSNMTCFNYLVYFKSKKMYLSLE